MWGGRRERGRKHLFLFLFVFYFCLREKNETRRGYPEFIFFARKKTRAHCARKWARLCSEKFPRPLCTQVSATLLRHCFDTASTLTASLHTHTHTHTLTYTRILEISSWCCERNPLSSYSYPYSTHTIHSLSTTCIFLPLNRQTKANWPDITRHINHLFRDLPITTAPTSELQAGTVT